MDNYELYRINQTAQELFNAVSDIREDLKTLWEIVRQAQEDIIKIMYHLGIH